MSDDDTINGFVHAARTGDLTALRVLADWFRERGQPSAVENGYDDQAAAYHVEALQYELEERHIQARKTRRLLSLLAAGETPVPGSRERLDPSRVSDLLRSHGLPVGVRRETGVYAKVEDGRVTQMSYRPVEGLRRCTVYLLTVPTDHAHEKETCDLLVAFLRGRFPAAPFGVLFRNDPLTAAGGHAESWLATNEETTGEKGGLFAETL